MAFSALLSWCALIAVAAVATAQTDECGGTTVSADTCYQKAANPTVPKKCVYHDGACVTDPCNAFGTIESCFNATGCMSMPFNQGTGGQSAPQCFTPELMCSYLPLKDCTKMPICAVRSNSFCGLIKPALPGANDVECDVKFPVWSLVLMAVWLAFMLIIGFVIFLIFFRSKNHQIKEVQHEEVVVDNMHINDNFSMGSAPLNNSGSGNKSPLGAPLMEGEAA